MSWHRVTDCLPDDAETVVIHSSRSNEPVWLGYYDSATKRWYSVEGDIDRAVTHWAEMPEPPTAAEA